MGVDAELYVWGDFVPDDELETINDALFVLYGKPFFGKTHIRRAPCNPVPDTHLLSVDLDGQRTWTPTYGRGYWPEIRRRIMITSSYFPNHFLILSNDACNLEDYEAVPLSDALIEDYDNLWNLDNPDQKINGWTVGGI